MTEFDEISRAIGRIEGKLQHLTKSTQDQWKKLDGIERTLTNHRITVAGIAGGISLSVSLFASWTEAHWKS